VTIELSELYRIARNAEGLLLPLATAPAEVWIPKLKPRDEDYAAVFLADAAMRARAGYQQLWASPPKALGKPNQTKIKAFAVQADAFASDNEFSREFPGGYRGIASQLAPDKIWVAWKMIEAGGELGMSYDGLVWLRDHWAWFPKPWRVLEMTTN
jgi:hypothetical protein